MEVLGLVRNAQGSKKVGHSLWMFLKLKLKMYIFICIVILLGIFELSDNI